MKQIYENDFFELSSEGQKVFLKVKKNGYTINDFNHILKNRANIQITQFIKLQESFLKASNEWVEIGHLKEEFELEVSSDEMKAYVKINLSQDEIIERNETLDNDIILFLKNNEIKTGILYDEIRPPYPVGKKLLVAKGIEPTPGEDSTFKYYELNHREPEVGEEGQTDFYEVELIDRVDAGAWLGEKTIPKSGDTGKTVKGHIIPARKGRDVTLKYDKATVEEVKEGDKFVLRAKNAGAVVFSQGKIKVDNHLVISGDVNFETGNIHFDGSVTVMGTVEDLFEVTATKDIEIRGDQGVGSVGLIESKEGSIFIKGGVNGKGKSKIVAKEDIYAKFANEAHLTAGGKIHIAKYAFDSYIKGSEILLDVKKGMVVGGKIEADHKVIAGSIGNINERKTEVNISGFDRSDIKTEFEAIQFQMNDIIFSANRIKRKLEIFEQNYDQLDERAVHAYKALFQEYEHKIDSLNKCNRELKRLESILRTRGEGEIKVMRALYPKTVLEIKKLQKQIDRLTRCSFYAKNNRLHTAD